MQGRTVAVPEGIEAVVTGDPAAVEIVIVEGAEAITAEDNQI